MIRLQKLYKRTYTIVLLSLLLFSCKRPPEEPEVYFSPKGGALRAIETQIDKAKQEIDVAMYAFTNDRLALDLTKAKDRGVRVLVVLDGGFAENELSKDEFLAEKGINLRLVIRDTGLMHNKFCIIDSKVLITGSYNWTKSAENRNDENLLVFPNAPRLVKRYKKRFDKIWKKAKPKSKIIKLPPLSLMATDLKGLRENAGKEVIVKGRVYRVYHSRRSDTYFLDFGPTRESFTCVIFKRVAKRFLKEGINPLSFNNKFVKIRGKVIDHPKYGLEIILESSDEIEVIENR